MDAFYFYWFVGIFGPVFIARTVRTMFHWLKVVRP